MDRTRGERLSWVLPFKLQPIAQATHCVLLTQLRLVIPNAPPKYPFAP